MSHQVDSKSIAEKQPPHTLSNSSAKPLFPIVGALVIGMLWLTGMLWLVLTTSNPVTLNREQIRKADFIVRGTIDATMQNCNVEESWPPQPELGSIPIKNLHATGAQSERDYLIPITRNSDKYLVTPTRLPNGKPLIYPATSATRSQLKKILDEQQK